MWVLYSLLSALTWATSDACAKLAMQRGAPETRLIFWRHLLAAAALSPLLVRGVPALDRTFWLMHLPWLPLEITGAYLYLRAIGSAPLSLTLPLLSLTPGFLVLTGWLLLGEEVGPVGLVGILLVVGGSYLLNLSAAQRGWLGPLRAIVREPGTRLMLLVALLYALTSLCGKVLVQHSSPEYFALHYAVVVSIVLAPLGLRRGDTRLTPGGRAALLASATMFSLMILFHMLAISTAIVACMIALKRLAGVFGVLYGRVLFREPGLRQRLTGAVIMVVGGLLIVLG